jgi:hypothetical protein
MGYPFSVPCGHGEMSTTSVREVDFTTCDNGVQRPSAHRE